MKRCGTLWPSLKLRSLLEAVDRVARTSVRVRRDRALRAIEQELTDGMAVAFLLQARSFVRLLSGLREEFPLRVEEARLEKQARSTAWEPLFDEAAVVTRLVMEKPIQKAAAKSLALGAQEVRDRIRGKLGYTPTFKLQHPRAVSFLERVGAERVTQVNQETKSIIRGILVESAEQARTYSETAERIIDRFGQFAIGKPQLHIDSRAHLVAVTETANAYCEGELQIIDQLEEQGLTYEMQWVTMGDDRVSDGCQANESAGWIASDGLFPSGDRRPPRFPGCRCDLEFRRVVPGKPEKPKAPAR